MIDSKSKFISNKKCNLSLAVFPNYTHVQSAQRAINIRTGECLLSEPLFGQLSVDHVQLVPQNRDVLTQSFCDDLMTAYPKTQWRLHANVCVTPARSKADLSNFKNYVKWFEIAGKVSQQLKSPSYSAHAGYRKDATLKELFENTKRVSELFDCPVAIEGQYPCKGEDVINYESNQWMISSWHEYIEVFESGLPYVVDLSHLNILATATGIKNENLIREMLGCERCLEVHVSDNDGTGDWHKVCQNVEKIWWIKLLDSMHENAILFSEGNHLIFKK